MFIDVSVISMKSQWFSLILVDCDWFSSIFVNLHWLYRFSSIRIDSHRFPWNFIGVSWISLELQSCVMDFFEISLTPHRFGVSWMFHGFLLKFNLCFIDFFRTVIHVSMISLEFLCCFVGSFELSLMFHWFLWTFIDVSLISLDLHWCFIDFCGIPLMLCPWHFMRVSLIAL